MAADIQAIIDNLMNFYDFRGKKIVAVGAGGGQLIEYGREAKQVLAIDCDAAAIARLAEKVGQAGLAEKFVSCTIDFMVFREKADVVLFEFSLHEMEDPHKALALALKLAPDVVILDHYTDSEWAVMVSEEEKVKIAWEAARDFLVSRQRVIRTQQAFKIFAELHDKVKCQGETSIKRIEKFRGQADFTIPMT